MGTCSSFDNRTARWRRSRPGCASQRPPRCRRRTVRGRRWPVCATFALLLTRRCHRSGSTSSKTHQCRRGSWSGYGSSFSSSRMSNGGGMSTPASTWSTRSAQPASMTARSQVAGQIGSSRFAAGWPSCARPARAGCRRADAHQPSARNRPTPGVNDLPAMRTHDQRRAGLKRPTEAALIIDPVALVRKGATKATDYVNDRPYASPRSLGGDRTGVRDGIERAMLPAGSLERPPWTGTVGGQPAVKLSSE